MSTGATIVLLAAAWIAGISFLRLVATPWLANGPRRDVLTGLVWRTVRVFVRIIHRAQFHGLEELRDRIDVGPLIVVSNHTGSVDPLLIQAGCRFHIRWLMAAEMMIPALDWFWDRDTVIPVERDARDLASARQAIRFVQGGGAVGIFPEGRIVHPPRQIRPFYSGVGLIVARAQAPVLLVWISGTPDTTSMRASIFTPSRARVQYLEVIDFSGQRDPSAITEHLRQRLAAASGWPITSEPQPPA